MFMSKILGYLPWLRFAFVPLLLFLALAIVGLVLKSMYYIVLIFAEIFTEAPGRLIHHALGLIDVILVVGLLYLMAGYVLYSFVFSSPEDEESLPIRFPLQASGYGDRTLKVKTAAAILLIATIDLLGEFIDLSSKSPANLDFNPERYWMLLAMHGALVITAAVLTWSARLQTDNSKDE